MGKFDGILICSDVDGTFRGTDDVFKVNAEAVQYFKENGGKFTFATGRGIKHMGEKKFRDVFNAPVCLCNGGVVYDYENECLLFQQRIPVNTGEIVKEICKKKDEIKAFHIIQNIEDEETGFSDIENIPLALLSQNAIKVICVFETGKKADEFKEFIRVLDLFKDCHICKSWEFGVEINDCNATKGDGVEFIKNYLGNIHTTIGIGDYENDIPLLEKADISIAVSNAIEKVKNVADRIVKPVSEYAIKDLIEILDKKY